MLTRPAVSSRPKSQSRLARLIGAVCAVCLTGGIVAVASERNASEDTAPEMLQASYQTTTLPVEGGLPVLQATMKADWDGIYRVRGDETPSGFDVPRFVSLKFGRVNARTGPSRNHAIAYQYRRRGLPVIVVAETEMWRKVRDVDGDEAWVRKPALSGERYAIFQSDSELLARPSTESASVARVEQGALVKLESCENGSYCVVRTASGFKGYTPKAVLWGAQDMN